MSKLGNLPLPRGDKIRPFVWNHGLFRGLCCSCWWLHGRRPYHFPREVIPQFHRLLVRTFRLQRAYLLPFNPPFHCSLGWHTTIFTSLGTFTISHSSLLSPSSGSPQLHVSVRINASDFNAKLLGYFSRLCAGRSGKGTGESGWFRAVDRKAEEGIIHVSAELPAVVLGWQGGEKRQESTRDQLKSDLFVGAGPGCGDLGQAGGL